jgi:hypothetical protein
MVSGGLALLVSFISAPISSAQDRIVDQVILGVIIGATIGIIDTHSTLGSHT